MRVCVFSSPRYAHLLLPFAYLFNAFWWESQPVDVVGVRELPGGMPENFTASPFGYDFPASNWTGGARQYLDSISDDWFILMLEDYWITRKVDLFGVSSLLEFADSTPGCVRMDLTTDILHGYGDGRNAHDVDSFRHYDIIEKHTDSLYRCSLQAGIFNRKYFLELCSGAKSPWEFELYNPLQHDAEKRVLGCRQWPVRYINAVDKGKLNWQQINALPQEKLTAIMPCITEIV